jgi:hypothetical protein
MPLSARSQVGSSAVGFGIENLILKIEYSIFNLQSSIIYLLPGPPFRTFFSFFPPEFKAKWYRTGFGLITVRVTSPL